MKKIFNIFLVALMSVFVAACGKEDPFTGTNPDGEGELSTKSMIVKIENEEQVVRSAIDLGSFIVDICRDGEVIYSYTYSEMPEVITLPVGTYTAKVRSGEVKAVEWDAPYFVGEEEFEIRKKEITEVKTVVCKLANVRVSIIFDEDLKLAMGDDAKVTVEMGQDASIDFLKNETRSAYFAYVEGSNTLVATFSGNIDGEGYEEFKAYADVKPGNHYKITYTYHRGGLPDDEGTIVFSGVNVDASVVEEDLTINVNPDDETIDPDDRPSQGGDEPGPNPPTPPTPGGGPSVNIPEDSEIVFDTVIDIREGERKKLTLEITSETGFTEFVVDIISPYLTDDFLSEVGMTTHLDLVNPGALEPVLGSDGFGLPVNVGGSKSELFDITELVPLLCTDSKSEVHEFRLTVADASGTTVKSISFRNLK